MGAKVLMVFGLGLLLFWVFLGLTFYDDAIVTTLIGC
jgi:hypothetical protein